MGRMQYGFFEGENLDDAKNYFDILSEKNMDGIPEVEYFRTHRNKHELVICKVPLARVMCGDILVQASGNNAFFYPANQAHAQLNQATDYYKRFFVQFPYDLQFPEQLTVNFQRFFCCPLTDSDMMLLDHYVSSFLALGHGMENTSTENDQKYLLMLMFRVIERRMQSGESRKPDIIENKDHLIPSICRFIHEHYSEPITLEKLAAQHFTSRATMTKKFRDMMGISINEYILRVRIGYAKQYLASGYSVSETSELCGFSDSCYFSRVFRKSCGVTPNSMKRKKHL